MHSYKILLTLIVTLLCSHLSTTFIAQASNKDISLEELHPSIARIIEKNELVVATIASDYPPFLWTDNQGNIKGYEAFLAQNLADALGVKLRFLRYSNNYTHLQNAIIKRKADIIISTYSKTLERAKYLNFSNPYFKPSYGFMVNTRELVRHDVKNNLVDFLSNNSMKIGIFAGSANIKKLKNLFPKAEIIEISIHENEKNLYATPYDKFIDMVLKGEIFAYFGADIYFAMQYENNAELNLFTKSYAFNDIKDSFVIGIHKEDYGLQSFINIYLETMGTASTKDIISHYVLNNAVEGK